MSNLPPAGWYPDPQDPARLRYWDGSQWTGHRAPARQPSPEHVDVGSVPPEVSPDPGSQQPNTQPDPAAPAISEQRSTRFSTKVPLFGARKHAQQTSQELERLRAEMERLGVLDVADLRKEREDLQTQIAQQRAVLEQERSALNSQLAELRGNVVLTQEAEILQEVGIYEYRHPLADSIAYKAELSRLQDQIKTLARQEGGAIRGHPMAGQRLGRPGSQNGEGLLQVDAEGLQR